MGFADDARKLLRRLAEGFMERLGQEPGLEAVGVVQELAFAADEQGAAFLVQLFIAKLFGLVGLEAAVVPGELDGRHSSARGKLVERQRGARVRDAIERRRDGFNAGRERSEERRVGKAG